MRVLFLTHRLPYAPDRGDRIRSYHLLRAMRPGAEIHLFSLVDATDADQVAALPSWLASVTVARPNRLRNYGKAMLSLAGQRPLTHTLLGAADDVAQVRELAAKVRPDLVFAYCTGIAPLALQEPLHRLPCVLDMVDVDSEKWRSLAQTARFPMSALYAREARVLRPFEAVATRHAAATLVVNDRERRALAGIVPDGGPIEVIENGVDCEFFRNPADPPPSEDVVFCGVMDYAPNVDGVVWFVEQVWPRIRERRPGARFTIVGANPAAGIQRLARLPGIEVTGRVADVRPYLWRAGIAIAPLFTSRGLQNKVLEALAAGLPAVTTQAVRDGLPDVVGAGCRVADDPATFVEHVIALLNLAPGERRALSQAAHVERLGWEARLSRVPGILDAAIGRRHDALIAR